MSEEGVCPKCRYPLTYAVLKVEDSSAFYPVECSNCGFIGKQWYHLEFEAITDEEGEEV